MALTSTIVNDLVSGTSTLTLTSGSTVESVVYTNSTRSFVFATQVAFNLSALDFIKFVAILVAFKLSIDQVFAPSGSFTTFNVSDIVDTNDGINALNFVFAKAGNALYTISATYPAGTINFARRLSVGTLTYAELVYYLLIVQHFQDEVRKTFGI